MKKHLNILLVNCVVVNGNKGCVALTVSTMFLLSNLLDSLGYSYTFYLSHSGYSDFSEHELDFVGGKKLIYNALPDLPYKGWKVNLKKKLFKGILKKSDKILKSIDYVFDIGQGDSFSDIYGKDRFNYITYWCEKMMFYKKHYCFLPQTIGPFDNETIRNRAVSALQFSDFVLVRDSQSYDYVKNLLPEKSVSEIIDVAFFMPYSKKILQKDKVHVGLNVSALLWIGGYTLDNQFKLNADYQKVVRKIIDFFLSMPDVVLHLVPHVVEPMHSVENDYEISCAIKDMYDNSNLELAPFFLDPVQAKSYIAGLDFFMGARMHSTIAAFSSCVPVVPMAYSRKFNGLFEDTLNYHHIVDLKVDGEEKILNIIKQNFENRTVLKNEEQRQMETIVADAGKRLEEDICKFLHVKNR